MTLFKYWLMVAAVTGGEYKWNGKKVICTSIYKVDEGYDKD
jgi:hypothetical protein